MGHSTFLRCTHPWDFNIAQTRRRSSWMLDHPATPNTFHLWTSHGWRLSWNSCFSGSLTQDNMAQPSSPKGTDPCLHMVKELRQEVTYCSFQATSLWNTPHFFLLPLCTGKSAFRCSFCMFASGWLRRAEPLHGLCRVHDTDKRYILVCWVMERKWHVFRQIASQCSPGCTKC